MVRKGSPYISKLLAAQPTMMKFEWSQSLSVSFSIIDIQAWNITIVCILSYTL